MSGEDGRLVMGSENKTSLDGRWLCLFKLLRPLEVSKQLWAGNFFNWEAGFSLSNVTSLLPSSVPPCTKEEGGCHRNIVGGGTCYLPGGVRFTRGRWQPSPQATVPCRGSVSHGRLPHPSLSMRDVGGCVCVCVRTFFVCITHIKY